MYIFYGLAINISNFLEARENQNGLYDAKSSHAAIKNICQQFINSPISNFQKAPRGNGVDIWLQKDGRDYFFDTKTVQPNVGDLKKFLRQILYWYAYFYSKNPTGNAEGRIVFPYNPYPGDFWKYCKAGGRPLEKNEEAWVENQFWDFVSGVPNTFDLIKGAFMELYDEKTLEIELRNFLKFNKIANRIVLYLTSSSHKKAPPFGSAPKSGAGMQPCFCALARDIAATALQKLIMLFQSSFYLGV